jgi:hypothetical protein
MPLITNPNERAFIQEVTAQYTMLIEKIDDLVRSRKIEDMRAVHLVNIALGIDAADALEEYIAKGKESDG